jgi:hypothetical protein
MKGVVLEFRQRRHTGTVCNSILEFAVNKCEEAFRRSEWSKFGYWFTIYRREKAKMESKVSVSDNVP